MKLKCHRPSLATAFQVVNGVVPARTTKDILKNVKLQVEGGTATLIGTDSEVGVRYEIPQIETDSAGETLLPTGKVISILRELQDESVELEVADDAVWIRSAHSQFRLSASEAAEFPNVAGFEGEPSFTLPGGTFRQMIQRTIFATDVESTRYALGGVLVDLEPERITMAATDTRRLAMVECVGRPVDAESLANRNPVIPSKAMALIERSIEDDEEDVAVAVYPNHVLVKTGRSTIYSRLVEGRFPRYRDVIPQQPQTTVELVVGPFHSVVRQAQIVTNEESRGVDFQFAEGLLTLNSQAADVGQSTVELPISYDGAPLTITFDPRFIAEFLRVLDPGAAVRLELINPESAAVLRTDDAYTYVIMPLSRER